ncbi:MAG: PQQ-dependent sugar dehydrogenase [Jatrophihabitantaceae bacterium]
MPRLARPGFALAAALLLAGCGARAQASDPKWVPQPSFTGEAHAPSIVPIDPQHPPASRVPGQRSPGNTSPTPSGSPTTPAEDPAVVAKHLAAPTGLVLLPDGTALVGERTTGRILQVQPQPGKPIKIIRTIGGVSTVGGGGLLDLALSPHYGQDSLIFAYVTTATDNRVVAFTLTGPVTPVLTGIPRGPSDNAGRITFGADGDLYIGTGDAGRPADAANLAAESGKVLRVTDIGQPAPNNPSTTSPMFTSGHRVITGLCVEPNTGDMLEVGPEAQGADVNVLVAGRTYGWPHVSVDDGPSAATLPAADGAPGSCAVQQNTLYITSLDGHALLQAPLTVKGTSITVGSFKADLVNKYGRLLTVVAAPDGALWLTTANRDGHGQPIPDDERVLRIVMSGGGADAPV